MHFFFFFPPFFEGRESRGKREEKRKREAFSFHLRRQRAMALEWVQRAELEPKREKKRMRSTSVTQDSSSALPFCSTFGFL